MRSHPMLLCLFCCAIHDHGAAASPPAASAVPAPVPIIVELFSSEGCSSCPPADVLLDRLARQQAVAGAEILAIEQHVDYWNHLGWKDPFSSSSYSERQYGYADAFGRDGVYTPQMIVDGQAEFTGSNSRRAEEEIAIAARRPHAKVTLAQGPGGLSVSVMDLPPLSPGDTAELWLALTEGDLSTQVPRGENAGHLLRHAPIARELRRVGTVPPDGYKGEIKLASPAGATRDRLRAVVFVQEARKRRILGAAALRLGR
jgi:hypothetical protein